MSKFTININGIDYLKIKDVNWNNKMYTIYLDLDTQSNAIVCDDENKIIKDIETIKNVMSTTFNKSSSIKHEDLLDIFEDYEDDEEEIITLEYGEKEKKQIFLAMKKIFFKKFGNELLSEENLNKRISENIKKIFTTNHVEEDQEESNSLGTYDYKKKEIRVYDENPSIKRINKSIMFHEFIHGIAGGRGAIKEIDIAPYTGREDPNEIYMNKEYYEYGRGIDEGIVSYIQFMAKAKEWEETREKGSYDENRRIVNKLMVLYNNVEKDSKYNFVEEYILDSKNTLCRIKSIFEDYIKSKKPNEKPENIDMFAKRQTVNFVVSVDELLKNSEKLEECEKILDKVFKEQISKKQIKTKADLYNVLYEIQGYLSNSSFENNDIEKLIGKKIDELLKNNKKITIQSILSNLPKSVNDSPKMSPEQKFIAILWGREINEDSRYADISMQLSNLRMKKKDEPEKE